MQIKQISSSARPPGLLRKAGGIVATVVVAGVALMFSAVLLTVVLSVASVVFVYLWWKTRELRKQMRQQMRDFPAPGVNGEHGVFRGEAFEGEVIEGEAIRVDEAAGGAKR